MIHIVICDNKDNELNKIIKGERTVLLRGNASRRIPHSRIFINDELYFLQKGENIAYYYAVVKNADSYSKLDNIEVNNIISKYNDRISLSEKEMNKWNKKNICIIEFENLEKIDGLSIPKYTPLEDWIMVSNLDELNNR